MRLLIPLVLAAVAAAPVAQVPYDYLLVTEKTKQGRPAMRYLQPLTNVITTLSIPNNSWWSSVDVARLDPAQPNKIYWARNINTPIVQFYEGSVSNTAITAATNLQAQVKQIDSFVIIGSEVFFVEMGSPTPGLWKMAIGGGVPVQQFLQIGLHDVVQIGTDLYTITFMAGAPSTIIKYDTILRTNTTLGSLFPPGRALGQFGGNLLVGAENGDIYQVLTATGTMVPFLTPNNGPVTAIASRAGSNFFYYVAGPTSNEVYSFLNPTTPMYTVPTPHGPVSDITLGIHDQASFLTDGVGCAGSGGTPNVTANGLPRIGNANFTVILRQGGANKAGAMVVGTNRATWGAIKLPFSLTPTGMTGCTLYTDVIDSIGVNTNANGVGNVLIGIPNFQWKGGHLTGQFVIFDAGANPLGVTASNGFEAIVR